MTTVLRILGVLLIGILLAFSCAAQTTGPPTEHRSMFGVLTDADNIAFLSFIGANLADAKTDWRFTAGGKEYTINPAQRLTITLGATAAALYIREQFPDKPKLRKTISVLMGGATAYFAGRALANTYNHGVEAGASTTLPVAAARARDSPVAFAVRLH